MDRKTRATFAGCLLGGAVGDALGAPVEHMSMVEIQNAFGTKGIHRFARAFGKTGGVTDDTQMMLFTAEGLLRAEATRATGGDCNVANIVRRAYVRWSATQGEFLPDLELTDESEGWLYKQEDLHHRRSPGTNCLAALALGHLGTIDEPINHSKGCGGLMRIAPVGLVADEPFALGCEIAAITHGHPSGYLPAGFMAHMISELVGGKDLADAIASARSILLQWEGHEECLKAVDAAVALVHGPAEGTDPLEKLGRGWVAEEVLAASIYCALTAPDYQTGVLRAVNHGGDSDTAGCVTGCILGARWGVSAIPDDWLAGLELRDVIEEISADLYTCFVERPTEPAWDPSKYPPC